MRFFVLLCMAMFAGLVVEHFIAPLPPYGVRVLLLPVIMFYGALALPLPGMLALAFCGGLMWDSLHVQIEFGDEPTAEVALGWSIVLYAILGGLMSGFRPLFQRGRWEIHCLLCGVCTSVVVLAEYLMLTFRREPVVFVFNKEIWWRIGGAGLIAALLSPFFFFALNYLAYLVGHDPQPARKAKQTS
ncbi:MAG: hypothetical protein WDN28_21760 [Chthoniobacter sp.]